MHFQSFFLPFQITDLQHSVLSPLSFRLDYKRGTTTTPTMFQRQVRMQVNISDISENSANSDSGLPGDRKAGNNTPVHAITFTLLSGIGQTYNLICRFGYFCFEWECSSTDAKVV